VGYEFEWGSESAAASYGADGLRRKKPIPPISETALNRALNCLDQKARTSAGHKPFSGEVSMNYQAFTKATLILMHSGARGALSVDDELATLGEEVRFKVRDTLNWTLHITELEAEMTRRGMDFEFIDCSSSASEGIQQPQIRQRMNVVDLATHLSTRIAAVMRIRRTSV
jgi:hypothetical protein